jgi:hypothetical protein
MGAAAAAAGLEPAAHLSAAHLSGASVAGPHARHAVGRVRLLARALALEPRPLVAWGISVPAAGEQASVELAGSQPGLGTHRLWAAAALAALLATRDAEGDRAVAASGALPAALGLTLRLGAACRGGALHAAAVKLVKLAARSPVEALWRGLLEPGLGAGLPPGGGSGGGSGSEEDKDEAGGEGAGRRLGLCPPLHEALVNIGAWPCARLSWWVGAPVRCAVRVPLAKLATPGEPVACTRLPEYEPPSSCSRGTSPWVAPPRARPLVASPSALHAAEAAVPLPQGSRGPLVGFAVAAAQALLDAADAFSAAKGPGAYNARLAATLAGSAAWEGAVEPGGALHALLVQQEGELCGPRPLAFCLSPPSSSGEYGMGGGGGALLFAEQLLLRLGEVNAAR